MPRRNDDHMLQALEIVEGRYRSKEALRVDPLVIPRRYPEPLDQEIAAWISAHLAYGRVAPMLRAIEGVLKPLGASPVAFLRGTSSNDLASILQHGLGDWVWRFHTAQDLIHWLLAWKLLDEESHGQGLEEHLIPTEAVDPETRLSALVQRLRLELPDTYGIRFMLPDPLEGSACKRWRLFLRRMVRTEWPDLGIWRRYPMDSLMIPLDTHVARISQYLGYTARRTADGNMAREITESLRKLDPRDPLRFDFALSHMGILGDCPVIRHAENCARCPLSRWCKAASSSENQHDARSSVT